jgi:hypothetical protein
LRAALAFSLSTRRKAHSSPQTIWLGLSFTNRTLHPGAAHLGSFTEVLAMPAVRTSGERFKLAPSTYTLHSRGRLARLACADSSSSLALLRASVLAPGWFA